MKHTFCWIVVFYEDLRREMLDVVSSTFSGRKQPIEVEKARKDEKGRKKILAALEGVVHLSTRTESSCAAFLQAGDETQEQYRSGSIGPKDMR